jgi:hypothetical protein
MAMPQVLFRAPASSEYIALLSESFELVAHGAEDGRLVENLGVGERDDLSSGSTHTDVDRDAWVLGLVLDWQADHGDGDVVGAHPDECVGLGRAVIDDDDFEVEVSVVLLE